MQDGLDAIEINLTVNQEEWRGISRDLIERNGGGNLGMAIIREHLAAKGLGLHNDLQNEHSVVGNNIGLLLMLPAPAPKAANSLGFAPDYEAQDRVLGNCDRCRVPMDPLIGQRNIRIDRCPKCGAVFLDQGELAEMRKP